MVFLSDRYTEIRISFSTLTKLFRLSRSQSQIQSESESLSSTSTTTDYDGASTADVQDGSPNSRYMPHTVYPPNITPQLTT